MGTIGMGGRVVAALLFCALTVSAAEAARCGKNSGGFERWKKDFAKEAKSKGISRKALSALARTRYSNKTIRADRGQRSFKLSLQQFMKKRGASAITRSGKRQKKKHSGLLKSIERRYGVPAGPIMAIWGMETGFGSYLGNTNILSASATLAYDCRRSKFFTTHLYAALRLVENGSLSAKAVGAAHGEVGQTQFLPGNVLKYGVDGDGNGRVDLIGSRADAFASTANFLRAHGWKRGRGYQPGQRNFRALQAWNAARVYQQAIAIIGKRIDGG